MKNIIAIANLFNIDKVLGIEEYGSGIVNETYIVNTETVNKYILQKLHKDIAKDVLHDISAVTLHLKNKGLETPILIKTSEGNLYIEHKDEFWRMLSFIDGISIDKITDPQQAESAGKLIGNFHNALYDLDYLFKHSIAHFHDTDFIIKALIDTYSRNNNSNKYNGLRGHTEFIIERYEKIRGCLSDLPDRIIHGDLKTSNVIFDRDGNEALCLIDLDTLGRNKIVIDLGDALRSMCNTDNKFDLTIFKSFINGYCGHATFITKEELTAIPDGIRTIILELSARYVIDSIEQKYFRLDKSNFNNLYVQNKSKAISLIELYNDFEEKYSVVNDIISYIKHT